MQKIAGLVLVACLCWVSHGNARGLDRASADAAFRACDSNRDDALATKPELDCYSKALAAAFDRNVSAPTSGGSNKAKQAVVPAAISSSTEASTSVKPLLRRSMAAISSFAEPTSHEKAAGAQFAWSEDGTTENTLWSAQGIAAISFVHYGEVRRDDPYLQSLVVAPYIAFDRTSNSKLTRNNIDDLTYGGVVEAAWSNVFLATQYFRAGANMVTSFAGEEKNWGVTAEWQPVGLYNPYGPNSIFSYFGGPLPRGRGVHYLGFTLSPKLVADYRSELGERALQPLFSTDREAFRTGPAVTFTVDGLQADYVPWWLQRIHYQITYGWLYDWVAGRDYDLLDTSLTIGLDELQHLGLTLSYRKGEIFDTGQDVDLANIALSVSY